jgi:hypothetical protein
MSVKAHIEDSNALMISPSPPIEDEDELGAFDLGPIANRD